MPGFKNKIITLLKSIALHHGIWSYRGAVGNTGVGFYFSFCIADSMEVLKELNYVWSNVVQMWQKMLHRIHLLRNS